MLKPCEVVRLACWLKPVSVPYLTVIPRVGYVLGNCKVVYAKPVPCIVSNTSEVEFTERCEVEEEELSRNVLLKIKYLKTVEYLIYSKNVWETVKYRYFEPLSLGDVPKEPGLLLHGPPGTGKTSMLDLLGLSLGLHVVEIRPDAVLSKWVGESERNLAKLLKEAESMQPSIVKLDDAEWVVKSREFTPAGGGAEVTTTLTLLNILLNKIPSWRRNYDRILAVVATNISPSRIDPALLRSGRLGKPIFLSLPDFEAVYTLMTILGLNEKLGEKKTLETARKLVNIGANMADVKTYIQEMLDGRSPKLEDVKGRGYVRPMPSSSNVSLKKLSRFLPKEMFTSPKTRIYLPLPSSVAEPLIIHYLIEHGITTVLLTDERFFDEALYTAETTKSVLLVNCETVSKEAVKLIHNSARTPIVYFGSNPQLPCFTPFTLDTVKYVVGLKELARLLFDYYNVSYGNDLDIVHKVKDYHKLVSLVKYCGNLSLKELVTLLEG